MVKKERVGIIGHFGGEQTFLDGQTVKTQILYNGLKNAYDILGDRSKEFVLVDTYYNKVNRKKLVFDTFKCIFLCRTIILLLSINGMKIYFPLMYWVKRLFHRRVFHDVIGGNLAKYVKQYPSFCKYLNSFDQNWVEFGALKSQLEELGISNCIVIPNFKQLNLDKAVMNLDEKAKYRFCMFSRVMKEKGITDAILAIEKYNQEHQKKIGLEIWGPVEDRYKEEFESLIMRNSPFVLYKGIVDYQKSVETLTNHLALLFPTYWSGEGFPGTIIDAYSAGLPVIATDWNANSELIDDFQTGWIYPNSKTETLYDSIAWAIENQDELLSMRGKCHEKVKEYSPEVWLKYIMDLIES